jgi:membrane protein DedA with SNARE-associated domain
MNLFQNTITTIQTFSSSSALETVTSQALQTPPLAYFLCLLSAGFGVPVSEDALCLFAGTAWPTFSKQRRIQLFLALYAGVVLSDAVTFWAGRCLQLQMFEPLRLKFNDLLPSDDDEEVLILKENGKMRKRDRIRRKMKKAGDYVGFVIRFSVGTRGPLMLVTGFLGKVSFFKFILGSSVGALLTLPLQLWLGYTLGHNHPAAAVGIVGGISTVVLCATVSVAVVSWISVLLSKVKQRNAQKEGDYKITIVEEEEGTGI